MELHSSWFRTSICIHILNSNSLRHKLNYLDYSVYLVDFNNIDNLLLEEFYNSSIKLSQYSGISTWQGLKWSCEKMNKSFCSNIHHWNFNSSLRFNLNSLNTTYIISSNIGSLQKISYLVIKIKSFIRVFSSYRTNLITPYWCCWSKVRP